ncbi:MAG: ubiquinol-cytochrome chaperone [Alphaproteobacteria bacterium]|nr:ubiquinol-cytochrome chaperone [Alphaproteobacteria bacterium]
MTFLDRIFRTRRDSAALRPLYDSIVAIGRDPSWYREGAVPDTVDGRFDMVSAILSLVLLRLEREGDAARRESVQLTEIFIDDMDASLRQIGIGDFVVGKHVGKMMGALGGRLGAFRSAGGDLAPAVRRNIFRDSPPSEDRLAWVAGRLDLFAAGLGDLPLDALVDGKLPTL